jgi:hypothetical protein
MKILEGNMISDIIRRFHSIVCCNVNYKMFPTITYDFIFYLCETS